MTAKKKVGAAVAVLGLVSVVSMLIVRSPQELSQMQQGLVLTFSIYKPVGCNWRLVFTQPAWETNLIVVEGNNIILPPPPPALPGITNSAPGAAFDVQVIIEDSFRIAWQTELGKFYHPLSSSDLKVWKLNPIRFVGDGGMVGFDVALDADRAFYRVMVE